MKAAELTPLAKLFVSNYLGSKKFYEIRYAKNLKLNFLLFFYSTRIFFSSILQGHFLVFYKGISLVFTREFPLYFKVPICQIIFEAKIFMKTGMHKIRKLLKLRHKILCILCK